MPRVRERANYRLFSAFDRGRIVGLRKVGVSFWKIAERVYKSQDTVTRCSQAWLMEQRVRETG